MANPIFSDAQRSELKSYQSLLMTQYPDDSSQRKRLLEERKNKLKQDNIVLDKQTTAANQPTKGGEVVAKTVEWVGDRLSGAFGEGIGGMFWKDDNQVIQINSSKCYADDYPRVEVMITEI